jgi:hypothetical protein
MQIGKKILGLRNMQERLEKATTYTHSCFGHGQKCNVHFGRFVVSVAATFFFFFSFGFCAELLALSKFYLEWFLARVSKSF